MALEFESFEILKTNIDKAYETGRDHRLVPVCDALMRIAPPLIIPQSQKFERAWFKVILEAIDWVSSTFSFLLIR